MKKAIMLLILGVILMLPGLGVAKGNLFNLRYWSAPDNTRIVLDVSDGTEFHFLAEEGKLTLELFHTMAAAHLPTEIVLNRAGVRNILLFAESRKTVRVEVNLMENSVANVFKLKRFEDKPERLVIDVTNHEIERQLDRARQEMKAAVKGPVIVIDPGHGGEDPGAVGKGGSQEKDVVLDISRKLQRAINARPGFRAFLTREGDYYVPFKKRLKIARDYGADLFISIHADASRNRRASGSSVYSLSTGGASTEAAKILARKENLADIIGGTSPDLEIGSDSSPIILNMFQTHTINTSKSFGALVLDRLAELTPLKFSQVQEAPFMVLKLPEIPAVLIETLYISNPREEKLLKNKKFQERIAASIAQSVFDFMAVEPRFARDTPAKPRMAAAPTDRPQHLLAAQGRVITYEDYPEYLLNPVSVARVETPQKREEKDAALLLPPSPKVKNRQSTGGTVSKVVNLRNGSGNKVGRTAIYEVKKGDTLAKIASRHKITSQELAAMNGISPKGRLTQKKLKVPLTAKGKKA